MPVNFQNLWGKIEEKTIDITSIDVTTLHANLTINLTEESKLDGENFFEPGKLFLHLKGQIDKNSTITLVAHTHVDFDMDAVMITRPEANPELLAAHNQAVKTAIDARQSVIKLIKELFP